MHNARLNFLRKSRGVNSCVVLCYCDLKWGYVFDCVLLGVMHVHIPDDVCAYHRHALAYVILFCLTTIYKVYRGFLFHLTEFDGTCFVHFYTSCCNSRC